MPRFSISVDDDLNDYIEELADTDEYESKSDVVRALLRQGREVEDLDESLADLKARADQADDLETENDRLQRKLTEMNALRDEHQELVEYVEHERSLQERKARASLLERGKWWLFGYDEED